MSGGLLLDNATAKDGVDGSFWHISICMTTARVVCHSAGLLDPVLAVVQQHPVGLGLSLPGHSLHIKIITY